jgi:hypothetical protein
MQLHEFFKRDSLKDDYDRGLTDSPDYRPTPYAITYKKKYAKQFMKERNMDKFIHRVHDMDKEDAIEFCKLNEYRGSVLEKHNLTTVMPGKHTQEYAVVKSTLMTLNEYTASTDIDDPVLEDSGWWYEAPMPAIFKGKYLKALDKFQYVNYYKMIGPEILNDSALDLLYQFTDNSYEGPTIFYDELAAFISITYDTFA